MRTRNCCGSFVRRVPPPVFLALGVAFASAAFAQKAVLTPAPSPPAASAGPAAPAAPVSAALSRAVALYSDGAGHSSPFVQIYTPAGFATTRRESGTVSLQAPQRVRFDYTAPEKKVFTFDVGEGRFFSPEDKQ